jgi:hypothetical protein
MRYEAPPRSASGAPPQGGAAGRPAKPDPRRPLDVAAPRYGQLGSDPHGRLR